jgi:hypothetical protein
MPLSMPKPKLKLVRGGLPRFTMVYGMRLFPPSEVTAAASGKVTFATGESGRVTLHVLDGTREQIKRQLLASIDAFFDIYG